MLCLNYHSSCYQERHIEAKTFFAYCVYILKNDTVGSLIRCDFDSTVEIAKNNKIKTVSKLAKDTLLPKYRSKVMVIQMS